MSEGVVDLAQEVKGNSADEVGTEVEPGEAEAAEAEGGREDGIDELEHLEVVQETQFAERGQRQQRI